MELLEAPLGSTKTSTWTSLYSTPCPILLPPSSPPRPQMSEQEVAVQPFYLLLDNSPKA